MLIEGLVRLGQALLKGGLTPAESLELLSDVTTPAAQNFPSRVFVVELYGVGEKNFRVAALPNQVWGDYKPESTSKSKKEVFVPALDRTLGAPFVLPKGGNPRAPQGYYGVPVYPIYDGDMREFSRDLEAIEGFISARLKRTPSWHLSSLEKVVWWELSSEEEVEVAKEVQREVQSLTFGKEKVMGLLLLVAPGSDGLYELVDQVPQGSPSMAYIGPSTIFPGKYIVANLERVLDAFIFGKFMEGKEGGEIKGTDGVCAFCGSRGHAISAYCKAWPWFLPEWECPWPTVWDRKKDMVKGIGLCLDCYRALLYGASTFMKLATTLDKELTREIFSPVASARGKEASKGGGKTEDIFGCAYAIPLLDDVALGDTAGLFAAGIKEMMTRKGRTGKVDTHLGEITGFESLLPEEFSSDDFRLNITYFSGEPQRGDIHLRGVIEDVLPSTARELMVLARGCGVYAVGVLEEISGDISDKQRAFIRRIYSSLPYLLVTAFGGPYLWVTLEKMMHRRAISRERFISNVAARMVEWSHGLPDTHLNLRDEVIFYLTFDELLRRYEREILKNSGGGLRMRDWRELRGMLSEHAPEEMSFMDGEELGFACGYLVSLFSKQYWHATKSGQEGKDYLKHRVLTFGSDLTPEALWKRGLMRMEEYAKRLDIHLREDFKKRLAIVLMEYSRWRENIAKNKDAFLAAFWAGYELSGKKEEE